MAAHFELWPAPRRRLDARNLCKHLGHWLMRWVGGYALLASAICLFIATATMFATPAILATGLAVLLYTAAPHVDLPPVASSWNIVLAFADNAVGAWKAAGR